MFSKNQWVLPATILAAAFLLGTLFISGTWRNVSKANQTITVTGSAKKEIISDFGILRGTISVQALSGKDAYHELERQKPILFQYLAQKGFPKESLNLFTITNYPVFEMNAQGMQTNIVSGYVYSQRIELQSNDVNKIRNLSLEISSVIERGVNFSVEQPEYQYSKMAEIKIEIQAEAAKDAMIRAKKIAEATDGDLGTMRNARMGVLQITPKNSNMISDYGVNDLSSIEKEITAVVNASFEIK